MPVLLIALTFIGLLINEVLVKGNTKPEWYQCKCSSTIQAQVLLLVADKQQLMKAVLTKVH
jgi:hypothetical protein